MKQSKKRFLLSLFWKSLLLSASTFGGGYVIVSLMRRMYVVRMRMLTEEDMLDITAISQSAPGPVAVNASILLGYKTAGVAGAAVCLLGTVLPPLAIMTVLAYGYGAVRDNPAVAKVMRGMQAGVAAVILHAVTGMTRTALKNRAVYRLLFVLLLGLILLFHVNTAFCIGIAALLGIGDALLQHFRSRKDPSASSES